MSVDGDRERVETRQLAKEFNEFKAKYADDMAELRGRLTELREELKSEIAGVCRELRGSTALILAEIRGNRTNPEQGAPQSTVYPQNSAIRVQDPVRLSQETVAGVQNNAVRSAERVRVQEPFHQTQDPAAGVQNYQNRSEEVIRVQEQQYRPMEPQIRYFDNHFLHEMPVAGDGFAGNDELVVEKLSQLNDEYDLEVEKVEMQENMEAHAAVLHPFATEADTMEQIKTESSEEKGTANTTEQRDTLVNEVKEEETEMEEVDVAEGGETAEDTEMNDLSEGLETEAADEMGEAKEEEEGRSSGGKRKREKNTKAAGRGSSKKKAEEDVCFICFDGGDLVLCDCRGCPKAYHSSCVGHDEAFFKTKDQWNCGVHLCSNCKKNAYYVCYTCTFSLCKGCAKNSAFFSVKGNKGFCEPCRDLVMLIEGNLQGSEQTSQEFFDDKSSWEYLFKDYWIDLKERLCLASDEVTEAKNFCKGSKLNASKKSQLHEESGSEGSNAEVTESKSRAREGDLPSKTEVGGSGKEDWASKELLDVVMHMRNGDKSFLSRLELNQLILGYIKKHELRDRRNKSFVFCDSRLKSLFGKPRVGHIAMLNLLDTHIFYTKEDSHMDDLQCTVTDGESNQMDADWNSDATVKGSKEKKRKPRKKCAKGLQSNLDDYAAIDMHNINLIYLPHNLVEELLEDTETFHEKAVGAFVRIRIFGAGQKQDVYRLVKVIGTNKVAEPYKVGKRTTDLLLEILNLNKIEAISIDIISNQEFSEEECKRLRQSIKCGLIGRMTVGDVLEKATALQAVRVKDWLESEIVRLIHLRDRASDTGRRKELRECVEKLQLLKTPEEHQCRLDEIPEIHSDPNMDPSHESEEDEDTYTRPRGNSFGSKWGEAFSSKKKAEEDVCFICFDGGDLVLCDRRGCPKAYHPSCVGRDEAFFKTKGQWNCGVHVCSHCKKNAYYLCYLCTSSLCKGCAENSAFFSVKGNKGFCEPCRDLVMLIEGNVQGGEQTPPIDFDDKSCWEHLFKNYWIDLKERLCLTCDEVTEAKNLCKGSKLNASKKSQSREESDSEGSNAEVTESKSRAREGDLPSKTEVGGSGKEDWASKELLDVVMHMRNGDKSVLSRIELNQLMFDYIKKHELRDRSNKSLVFCDSRLKSLFGKPRVGHIEMLELLDSHLLDPLARC